MVTEGRVPHDSLAERDPAARRPQQHSHDGDDLPKAGPAGDRARRHDIIDRIFPTGTDPRDA